MLIRTLHNLAYSFRPSIVSGERPRIPGRLSGNNGVGSQSMTSLLVGFSFSLSLFFLALFVSPVRPGVAPQ